MLTFKQISSSNQLRPLINVAIFAILILGFHYFFRWWAYDDNKYWPIESIVMPIYEFMANLLYTNSVWAIQHLTGYEFKTNTELREIFMGTGRVSVNYGCSGFKQFLQWIVLMTFFPGPWKHKAWFILAGLIIIHIVNIFRISSLSIILHYGASQTQWDFTHDWILRPFFYVVMFGLWVFWVEKFVDKKGSPQ
jgi:exosortase/archaeosortase family protein